jgi:hypothetical protein
MNVTNISQAKDWFEVLQTGERDQTAMMTLAPVMRPVTKPKRTKKAIRFY